MIYEISMIYGNRGELSIQACVDILVEHTDGMRMRGWCRTFAGTCRILI